MHDEDALTVDMSEVGSEGMRGPRVVVAVDGSAGSKAALRFALEDATRRGVPVEAVIAYRAQSWVDYSPIRSPEEERRRHTLRRQHEDKVRAMLDEVARGMVGPVPDVQIHAALGSPAHVLIRESDGADLLVVGSRGHGGFHTVLLGSTSMQCAMHATCPVTIVHSPEVHQHRLRLHRERQEGRGDERQDEQPGEGRRPDDPLFEAAPLR